MILFLGAQATGWSFNPITDWNEIFSYQFMRNTFEAGTIVAIVAGVVGYFVVLRRTSFAAHTLSHVGFAGATGAVVVGVNPVLGLLTFCMCAAGIMGALGQRLRGRDTVIGTVLAWTLGLGVLFLSLYNGYATEAYAVLFGEILGISSFDVVTTLVVSAISLVAILVMYRPLIFASVDEDVAEARRVPVRFLSMAFMITLALAVSAAVQVVGVLLIFALIVTPAAIAERLTSRPSRAIALSVIIALVCTWTGLLIAYYQNPPPSFFITSIAFFLFLAERIGRLVARRLGHWHRRGTQQDLLAVNNP